MYRDKDKRLQNRILNIFKSNKNTVYKSQEELVIKDEVLNEIKSDLSVGNKNKAFKHLNVIIKEEKIQKNSVIKLLHFAEELLNIKTTEEIHHLCWMFLINIYEGQLNQFAIFKKYIFHIIKNYTCSDDVSDRIDVLSKLTEGGKDLRELEDEIGIFISKLFPEVIAANCFNIFCPYLEIIIKFNSAYISDSDIGNYILFINYLCCTTKNDCDIDGSLKILDVILRYSYLPQESLLNFISTLCYSVNAPKFSEMSWKIIKNLLKTQYLGHSSLQTLYNILEDNNNSNDDALLRGAIFCISMSLWSSERISKICYTPSAILPLFLKVLVLSDHAFVYYEIVLSLRRLLKFILDEPTLISWNSVVSILEKVYKYVETHSSEVVQRIRIEFHYTLDQLEDLLDKKLIQDYENEIHALLQKTMFERLEKSALFLIKIKSNDLNSLNNNWPENVSSFLNLFYKMDARSSVKIRALDIFYDVFILNQTSFGEDLLELSLFPNIDLPADDLSNEVQIHLIKLILKLMSQSNSKHFLMLLHVLDKTAGKVYVESELQNGELKKENCEMLEIAIKGLIDLLKLKFSKYPPELPAKIFMTLEDHLHKQYQISPVSENACNIRYMILECFLMVRMNAQCHIGFPDLNKSGKYCYSPFLLLDTTAKKNLSQYFKEISDCEVKSSVSLAKGFKAILISLKNETDWKVLEMVLKEIPNIIQNRALFLSKKGNDLCFLLASILCDMFRDYKSRLEMMKGIDFSKKGNDSKFLEFPNLIILVLESLIPYIACADFKMQQRVIKTLEDGLKKSTKACISVFTICLLELKTIMQKLIPEILHHLSILSATVQISINVLEFLSALVRLPDVYKDLTEEKYLSVLTTALPYSNPFKYNHFIVCLALHISSVWFLKCPQQFRKGFAEFFIKGLESSVLSYFGSANLSSDKSTDNVAKPSVTENSKKNIQDKSENDAVNFHKELTEVCLDFLTRYTFSPLCYKPKRSNLAEFLFCNGKSQTWIVGNRVITITTSGCGVNLMKNGLCSKCLMICSTSQNKIILARNSTLPFVNIDAENANLTRRRHNSALVTNSRISNMEFHSACETKSKDDSSIINADVEFVTKVDSTLPLKALKNINGNSSSQMSIEDMSVNTKYVCTCWCQNWAEIYIRGPTGDVSWIMQIQNPIQFGGEFPIKEITRLYFHNDENLPQFYNKEQLEDSPKNFQKYFKKYIAKDSDIVIEEENVGLKQIFIEKENDSEILPYRHVTSNPASPQIYESQKVSQLPHSCVSLGNVKLTPNLTGNSSPTPLIRDRSHTISVPNQIKVKNALPKTGINPSFILLQLQPNPDCISCPDKLKTSQDIPLNFPIGENKSEFERSLKILDLIPPYETHKIGIIYIGPNQAQNELDILNNQFGSVRYAQFLHGLGDLISLNEVDPKTVFLGGLEQKGKDGKFTYIWMDDITQIVFHVATLIPNNDNDPHFNNKKRHIGNDSIIIVYNESGEKFQMNWLKFLYACIVVEPLPYGLNVIRLSGKNEIEDLIGKTELKLVSDKYASFFARQLSLHASLASLILQSNKKSNTTELYVSNWLERLRVIKRLRSRLTSMDKDHKLMKTPSSSFETFTHYT